MYQYFIFSGLLIFFLFFPIQNIWAQDQEKPSARMVCSANYKSYGTAYSAPNIFEIPLSNAFPETVGGAVGREIHFELPGVKGGFNVFPTFGVDNKPVAVAVGPGALELPLKDVRNGQVTGLGLRHDWQGLAEHPIYCTERGEEKESYVATGPEVEHNLGIYPLRKGSSQDISFDLNPNDLQIGCGMQAAHLDSLTLSCDVEVDESEASYKVERGHLSLKSNVVQIYSGTRTEGKGTATDGEATAEEKAVETQGE